MSLMVFCISFAGRIQAGAISVPDGDFTQASGAGSIGGGLLGASGSGAINSGPWSGTYNANLGILLPPVLNIATTGGEPSGGHATIGGIVSGLDLLNHTVDNGAYFSQTLAGTPFLANTQYTLTANVDPGELVTAALLSTGGVGIGLTSNGSLVADTTQGPYLLSLQLLGGSDYQLVLRFITGASAPGGNLGIRLFDSPNGVAAASLIGGVSFSNVTLDATSATPEPQSMGLIGAGLVLVGFGSRKLKARGAKQ
jgi:hypothetical protein